MASEMPVPYFPELSRTFPKYPEISHDIPNQKAKKAPKPP